MTRMTPRRRIRAVGTTLAEVLVSAVFTAAIASAVLAAATQTGRRITTTEHRRAALCELQAQIAQVRATAETTTLSSGNYNSTIALPATPENVTVAKSVSLVPGYLGLYDVRITASWPEGGQTASVSLKTWVRAPND